LPSWQEAADGTADVGEADDVEVEVVDVDVDVDVGVAADVAVMTPRSGFLALSSDAW